MNVLESDVERLNKGKINPAENKIHDLTNEKMVRNICQTVSFPVRCYLCIHIMSLFIICWYTLYSGVDVKN